MGQGRAGLRRKRPDRSRKSWIKKKGSMERLSIGQGRAGIKKKET